jgi:hypothetical protein
MKSRERILHARRILCMSLAGVLQDCSAFFGNSSGHHFWHLDDWRSPCSLGI